MIGGRRFDDYTSIQQWFSDPAFKPSESYRKSCSKYMSEFCEFLDKDPDKILLERKNRLRTDPDDRTDENSLNRWYQLLLNRHAASFALAKYTAVVSFFNWNNKELNIAHFPVVDPGERREYRRLRKEEVSKMIMVASTFRPKNMLFIGAESGLRIQKLALLRLKHLVKEEDGSKEGIGTTQWKELVDLKPPVRIQLPKKHYYGPKKAGITYLCQDAIKSIVEDLKFRESKREPIGPETPLLPVYPAIVQYPWGAKSANTYFSQWQLPGTVVRVREPGRDSRNSRLVDATVEKVSVQCATPATLEYDMRVLREKANIEYDPEQERPVSVHGLRKYLRSTLDASLGSSVMVNVIIGHSNAVEEHYSGVRHLDISEVREVYESAMSRIAISEDVDRPRVILLENKIKSLEQTNSQLQELIARQKALEEQMVEMKMEYAGKIVIRPRR